MRQTTTGGGSVPLAAEPGSIARMTQGWRDHMLATHRRQVAIAKRRAAETEDRVNAKLQAVAEGIRGARG